MVRVGVPLHPAAPGRASVRPSRRVARSIMTPSGSELVMSGSVYQMTVTGSSYLPYVTSVASPGWVGGGGGRLSGDDRV